MSQKCQMIKKSQIQLQQQQPEEQHNMSTNTQPQLHPQPHKSLLDSQVEPAQSSRSQYRQFIQNRILTISGPELVTQNVIKSYKLYKIQTRKKDKQNYDTEVARRFSDFQYLQKQLVQMYGGCIIPLLPEKNFWANVNMEGEQEIGNRIKGLQKYLKSLLNHPKLRQTQQLQNFLFQSQIKFSQKKGEYFSKQKTEQKIKQLASTAYSYGKSLLTRYLTSTTTSPQTEQPSITKPSIEDLKLMDYQREVTDLIKVINVLRKVCENSVIQMRAIGAILMTEGGKGTETVLCEDILAEFQDLCKYIFSCNQALVRRNNIRMEIDTISGQLSTLQKKIKSNPRSQQVDILRNKLSKSVEKCQKWTADLMQELHDSITLGKSMIEKFVGDYTIKKEKFYGL